MAFLLKQDVCGHVGAAETDWSDEPEPVSLTAAGSRRQLQRLDVTPSQVALAWLLARSPVVLPIPGTSTMTHLEQNVAAARVRLTPQDMAELDQVAKAPEPEKKEG